MNKTELMNLLFLEHNVFVSLQVGHVDFLSKFQDFWVLSRHQPSNVTEEKATVGIMRVSISVRIFVVLTMITDPNIKAVLWAI